MFGFTAPWAHLCYSAVPKLVTKNFRVQVDNSSLMHSVFPHLLPPRNPRGVRGCLVTDRQDPWEPGSIVVSQVGLGVVRKGEVPCHKPAA